MPSCRRPSRDFTRTTHTHKQTQLQQYSTSSMSTTLVVLSYYEYQYAKPNQLCHGCNRHAPGYSQKKANLVHVKRARLFDYIYSETTAIIEGLQKTKSTRTAKLTVHHTQRYRPFRSGAVWSGAVRSGTPLAGYIYININNVLPPDRVRRPTRVKTLAPPHPPNHLTTPARRSCPATPPRSRRSIAPRTPAPPVASPGCPPRTPCPVQAGRTLPP